MVVIGCWDSSDAFDIGHKTEVAVHVSLKLFSNSVKHSQRHAQRGQDRADHGKWVHEVSERYTEHYALAELPPIVKPLADGLHEHLGFVPEIAQLLFDLLRQVKLADASPDS